MRLVETPLAGVVIVEPVVHRDPRGFFLEVFQQEKFRAAGLDVRESMTASGLENQMRKLEATCPAAGEPTGTPAR